MDLGKRSRGFVDAFQKEYGLGAENWAESRRRVRSDAGLSENAPRIQEMAEAHPLIIRLREILGKADSNAMLVREDMKMGLEPEGSGRRTGQLLGALAGDLTQDKTRSFYWLLNAPQASADVVTEMSYGRANPQLFGTTEIVGKSGAPLRRGSGDEEALQLGLIDENKKTTRGVKLKDSDDDGAPIYVKQNYAPGDIRALSIPTGIAINTGLGLMTPFGGAEGYEAAVPDAEDKTKTSNVIAEIGAKYLLGRTGNLLPYEEFQKVRPDVSRGEYNAYKAFKYDKKGDFDITDGDVTLPTGILKYTNEGIHGPELQFMGRSIPVTTGLIPYASALAGTTYGVTRNRPIRGGLVGGLAGLAAGQIGGNLIEQERRNRNMRENERKSQQIPQQGF